MDAGFVAYCGLRYSLNFPTLPVFSPVIRKFAFGDGFKPNCIPSQSSQLIPLKFLRLGSLCRGHSELALSCLCPLELDHHGAAIGGAWDGSEALFGCSTPNGTRRPGRRRSSSTNGSGNTITSDHITRLACAHRRLKRY